MDAPELLPQQHLFQLKKLKIKKFGNSNESHQLKKLNGCAKIHSSEFGLWSLKWSLCKVSEQTHALTPHSLLLPLTRQDFTERLCDLGNRILFPTGKKWILSSSVSVFKLVKWIGWIQPSIFFRSAVFQFCKYKKKDSFINHKSQTFL